MKQKLLKLTYIVDGIVLIISFIYFFMVYLSMALQSIAYAVGSYELLCFQSDLQTIIEFGVYYETAVWFSVIFFFAMLITAVFSAVFCINITSKTTYILMILSPMTILIQFLLPLILAVSGSNMTNDIVSAVWYSICLVGLVVYSVFTTMYMSKDLKNFGSVIIAE